MADGGEGTLETIAAINPTLRKIFCEVTFYQGMTRRVPWGLLEDGVAIVELALACGLTNMPHLDPLGAHTFAFGQLLRSAALHPGVNKIVASVGGSASTDGGVGALMALGADFLQESGESIAMGGSGLNQLKHIGMKNLVPPPKNGVVCLVDVTNPLLGAEGAARVFSPQKGANSDEVLELEANLANLQTVAKGPDFPGAGAAGGSAYGLKTLWGATIQSGSAAVAELVGLESLVSSVDYVITGEGLFDSQSLNGKVVGNLMNVCRKYSKPVLLCVGKSELVFETAGVQGIQLVDLAGSTSDAINNAAKWIELAASRLASRM